MTNQAKHPHQLRPSNEEMAAMLKKIRNDANPTIIETYINLHLEWKGLHDGNNSHKKIR